jgi:hypothetical protein
MADNTSPTESKQVQFRASGFHIDAINAAKAALHTDSDSEAVRFLLAQGAARVGIASVQLVTIGGEENE